MTVCVAGDARTDQAYEHALGQKKAALLLTDPPYCLLTRRRKGGDLRDKKDRKIEREPVIRFETVRDYRAFTAEWLPRALARLEEGAPAVVWTNFLGKEPLVTVARAHGYGHLWGEFFWAKRTTRSSGPEQLLRVYEVALVLSSRPRPAPTDADPPVPWASVAGYDDDGEAERWGAHPNHTPFGVLEPLIRAYSRPGDRVLDPFAGSGSIPAAAIRLGRRVACIEVRPEWAELVTRRLEAIP